MTGYESFAIYSTAADLTERSSPGGVIQWAIRFCQNPESLPVYLSWFRSIWPECPYSDKEIAEDLSKAHDLITRMLISGRLS